MNEEETARLRSYLAAQSTKRSPEQLLEALQKAYDDFLQSLHTIPDGIFCRAPHEGAWSAAEVLEHVQAFIAIYECAICHAISDHVQPEAVQAAIEPLLRGATREQLQASLDESYQRLTHTVLQAAPSTSLDITWSHFELGDMHWREWLLFTRVHLLEHVRQIQGIAQTIPKTDVG